MGRAARGLQHQVFPCDTISQSFANIPRSMGELHQELFGKWVSQIAGSLVEGEGDQKRVMAGWSAAGLRDYVAAVGERLKAMGYVVLVPGVSEIEEMLEHLTRRKQTRSEPGASA
jgi:hypothetical protein